MKTSELEDMVQRVLERIKSVSDNWAYEVLNKHTWDDDLQEHELAETFSNELERSYFDNE
jgi:hypothetical protein